MSANGTKSASAECASANCANGTKGIGGSGVCWPKMQQCGVVSKSSSGRFKVSLVMPVSGNKFVNEAKLAEVLVRFGCKFERILSTSGGSIVAIMLAASDVSSVCDLRTYNIFRRKYLEILADLDSNWYCKWKTSSPMLNTLLFIQTGAWFDRGDGEERISKYDIRAKDQPEIWMGTQNARTHKHQIWCTKSAEEASINPSGAKYLNGDVERITKATIASCSVPTFVPCMMIDGDPYWDGGMSHASPLGDFLPLFRTAMSNGSLTYHVIYISPARFSCSEKDLNGGELENDDAWEKMRESVAGMVTTTHVADRDNGIRVIGENAKTEIGFGERDLWSALCKQQFCKYSSIELSFASPVYINFVNMRKGDVLNKFHSLDSVQYRVRHDYVE